MTTQFLRVSFRLTLLVVLLSTPPIVPSFASGEETDRYSEIEKGIERLGHVYKHLLVSYYREISPDKIVSDGIEGMLGDLDPYTQYFSEHALKQLRIDTSGKFGGLGITISLDSRTRTPKVITVIGGTPADSAGMLPGDLIVEIDGKSTFRQTLREVVDQLRGAPDSIVRIAIRREGLSDPIPLAITRAQIKIESVTYAEEIEPGIGYIRMSRTRFLEETGQEVEASLLRLREKVSKGVILDLRGNPGGLLSQAREVSDKFLEPGQLIVSTKGRKPDQTQDYKSHSPAVLGKEIPLIVLVNPGSASASEIVAGAIQDADRGLILGETTFGKGSVQTVVGIDDETALKLTTALYYTPSGRSIHRRYGRAHINVNVDDRKFPVHTLIDVISRSSDRTESRETLVKKFGFSQSQADKVLSFELGNMAGLALKKTGKDSGKKEKITYKTAAGRPVYGGGGITPDVVIQRKEPSILFLKMEEKRMFLTFASHFAAVHPDVKKPFAVDSSTVAEFRAFLADTTWGFDYKTKSESRLDEIEKKFKDHDTSYATKAAIAELRKTCRQELELEFQEADRLIRGAIERNIASRLLGTRASIEAEIRWDDGIQESVHILTDPGGYARKMELAGRNNATHPDSSLSDSSPPGSPSK